MASADGLTNFEIAGNDKLYVPPLAVIVRHNVIDLTNSAFKSPKYVRYAWSDNITTTLL